MYDRLKKKLENVELFFHNDLKYLDRVLKNINKKLLYILKITSHFEIFNQSF